MKFTSMFVLTALISCSTVAYGDKADDFIYSQMRQQHIPGLSLAVIRNGKIIKAKGYGFANLELRVAAKPNTAFEIASMTKQFTATLVMMLIEEGKIGLDDKIARHIANLPDAWKEVTLQQLLTHTSGIKNYMDVITDSRTSLAAVSKEEVIKSVASFPLDFPSGDKWSYSNTGYFLLGMMLEKISGKSYPELLQERIFKPLHMDSSAVYDVHSIVPNRASGYEFQEGALRAADTISMTWPFAAGAITSTAEDLAKWDAALYTDRLLKASSLQQMWTAAKLNDGKTAPYGFGWFVDKRGGHRLTSHSGGIPGFSSQIIRFPDDKTTIILLCNQMLDAAVIANALAPIYIPALAPPVYKPTADKEPQVTTRVKRVVQQAAEGIIDGEAAFTPELAATMLADLKRGGGEALRKLGPLQSIQLVERKAEGANRIYRYRLTYKTAKLATVCTFNQENKISAMTLLPE